MIKNNVKEQKLSACRWEYKHIKNFRLSKLTRSCIFKSQRVWRKTRVYDISAMPFRRRCFGDGTFRRWWSQMFYTKKVCFWNTSMVRLVKDVCLISVFVVILRSSVVSLPPEVWNSLVRPWPCVEGKMACDASFCWHEAFVSSQRG